MKDNPAIAVRGGVGPNAGHTNWIQQQKIQSENVAKRILNENTRLLIGPGVVVSPEILLKEIEEFGVSDRSFVDFQCGIIEESHKISILKAD